MRLREARRRNRRLKPSKQTICRRGNGDRDAPQGPVSWTQTTCNDRCSRYQQKSSGRGVRPHRRPSFLDLWPWRSIPGRPSMGSSWEGETLPAVSGRRSTDGTAPCTTRSPQAGNGLAGREHASLTLFSAGSCPSPQRSLWAPPRGVVLPSRARNTWSIDSVHGKARVAKPCPMLRA